MYRATLRNGILVAIPILTLIQIKLSSYIIFDGPRLTSIFQTDQRMESMLLKTCKDIPGNAIQKEFRSMDYLKHSIPPESMLNKECVEAFDKSTHERYTILEEQICRHRFIFVSGMHFSGTSTLNYLLQHNKLVIGHSKTGAPEDEGMWLQNEYKQDVAFGGPCLFELHDDAYLDGFAATTNTRRCIFSQWAKYWDDMSVPILIEKSPPTITQIGFREKLFPAVSSHVITVRHPLYTCFWKFIKELDHDQDVIQKSLLKQKLVLALEAWLKTHEHLINDSLKNLRQSTKTAIFMVEDLFLKKDAIEMIQNIPQILFPELYPFHDNSSKELDANHRRLEFRGELTDIIQEFDPTRITSWMDDWNEKMVRQNLLSKWNLLSSLEKYEGKINKFGYSLLDVSDFNPKTFKLAFSLDENHLYHNA